MTLAYSRARVNGGVLACYRLALPAQFP